MAHYAEVKDGIVQRVVVVDDSYNEEEGAQMMASVFGGKWVKTSYNTSLGIHKTGGTPLRGNYAGPGYVYDEVLDAFYAPDPSTFPGEYVLNTQTYDWDLVNPPQEETPAEEQTEASESSEG